MKSVDFWVLLNVNLTHKFLILKYHLILNEVQVFSKVLSFFHLKFKHISIQGQGTKNCLGDVILRIIWVIVDFEVGSHADPFPFGSNLLIY